MRALCSKHDILLVFDELVTGVGRSGKLYAGEWYGVKPDMLVLGRSLGGAHYPVSVVMLTDEISNLIK